MEIPENLTPAMKQFKIAKEQYPDAIIFFRMGDFYETFYDDAKITARELEITLTKRGTKAKIPLAGIPYHALDTYLPRLVKKGYKVAICEQIEDPKKAKGIVKRDIVRVVTPGTLTESLDENNNNFIMAVAKDKDVFGIAIADLSTGDFQTTEVTDFSHVINELTRYSPSEILIDFEPDNELKIIVNQKKVFLQKKDKFSYKTAYETLIHHFNTISLDCFGIEDKDLCVISSGALFSYLKDTQKTDLANILTIKNFSPEKFMILDSSTLRNLEITNNIIDGSSKNTLLEAIDSTITSMGSRLLKNWIKRPLINKIDIQNRFNSVELLKNNALIRTEIEDILKEVYDMERLISRISYKTANPRDLNALKSSIDAIPKLKNIISKIDMKNNILMSDFLNMNDLNEISELISSSIKDEPPLSVRDGGFIKKGFNEQLDELRKIKSSGKDWIIQLETKEKEKLGVNLKIGFNKVFGYFIEVSRKNQSAVPSHYVRKQTTANTERYITDELKEKEELILGADEKIKEIEYDLFMHILNEISKFIDKIQLISKQVATLDILNSFASTAYVNNYCKPIIHEGYNFEVKNSRHPVIEQKQQSFVPNDIFLDENLTTMIITGPNMAGKSTYMRQIASISLLAQIGCFVPADSANLSIVDRIFTRVGAYDNLVMGQSTFMVEMNETANILNNATINSLVILDEIGRGTSTFDGVSIAWSVVEFLAQKLKCKTLFATHYHALNKLSKEYPTVKNYNIAAKERDDEIIFLRKIVEGGTDKSYGIQVARLAGLPESVIRRSKEIMNSFEKEDEMKRKLSGKDHTQMNLYDALR
jgi:DNA mismatch repair protein MutS